MAGRRLAHYEILERLGASGMGVAYRARDTKLERVMAVKVASLEWRRKQRGKS